MAPTGHHIVQALGGRWHGHSGMARCPAHEDGTPSLHVTETRDGVVLVKCFGGCEQGAVLDALRARDLWPGREETAPRAPRQTPRPGPSEDEIARAKLARRVWQEAEPIDGTPAESYLRWRGIRLDMPPTLRFAPYLRHPLGRDLPALVCAVQDPAGRVTAVQRIYLQEDGRGKADIEPAKCSLGPLYVGAVRLGRPGRVMGLCEGPETGLSAMQRFRLPVWCALGATRLPSVWLPDECRHVIVFADPGKAGQEAAERVADLHRGWGRTVDIETPEEGDWNDVVRAQVRVAVPA
jgi:hypothetical protein